MSEGRALLTDREREALTAEETGSYRYKTRSYLRSRLEELERDAEVLREHEPELFAELQAVVCDGAERPAQTAERAPAGEDGETHTPTRDPGDATDTPAESDRFADVVDRVAEGEGWEDGDERLAARKAAARAVLEYAAEHGSVSKQEAKEELEPEYSVDGQTPRTWYRKNIRPVLNEAAEYDNSAKGYRLKEE